MFSLRINKNEATAARRRVYNTASAAAASQSIIGGLSAGSAIPGLIAMEVL